MDKLIVLIIAILIFCIGPYLFMLLWNWIMPYLFNLPQINFWMALGIMVLMGLIFPKKSN